MVSGQYCKREIISSRITKKIVVRLKKVLQYHLLRIAATFAYALSAPAIKM